MSMFTAEEVKGGGKGRREGDEGRRRGKGRGKEQ